MVTFQDGGIEPTPAVLKDMCEAVKSYHADFGVAYDGCGEDRSCSATKTEKSTGNRPARCLQTICFQSIKEGQVVTTVSTSSLVGLVAVNHGARAIWTTVGSVDVSRVIIDNNAPLGLEENGGFFYGLIPVRDGAMTTARVPGNSRGEKSQLLPSNLEIESILSKEIKVRVP